MVSKLLLQWLLVMMTVVEAYLTQFLREKPISFLCSYFCCCNCFHFFTQTTTYDVHQMNRKKVENLIWFVFERTVRGIAFKRTISARCEFKVNCFLFRIGREKFNNVVDAFFSKSRPFTCSDRAPTNWERTPQPNRAPRSSSTSRKTAPISVTRTTSKVANPTLFCSPPPKKPNLLCIRNGADIQSRRANRLWNIVDGLRDRPLKPDKTR